jgi:LmbE family N-acetylglucosaminyl deacetylase
VLNVVAHPDDDLLFLSPALLASVRSGAPVHTVFLTAGDDGRAAPYWQQRELGIRSAYALMAGVDDVWHPGPSALPDVSKLTLAAAPQVSVTFLRLPDGGAGRGFPRYGRQSLPRLWRGEQSSIRAVDGSAGYSRATLIDALLATMQAMGPHTLRTQDFRGSFGDGDHNDHHAAAYLTKSASRRFGPAHRLESYQDYAISGRPVNVSGSRLQGKQAAFSAYATHDPLVCTTGTSPCSFSSWVKRQYRLSVGQ